MSDKSTKPALSSASPLPGQQSLTIQHALESALQHHASGRLPQAESIYQGILQTDPNQPVALHLLGVIAHQVGKNDIAVDLITKALTIKPDYAEAHNNLGLSLQDLGKLDEAIASYRKALTIRPNFAEAQNNLGNALKDIGKLDEAVTSYHRAVAIKPDYAKAHSNLLLTLNYRSDLSDDEVFYEHLRWNEQHALPLTARIQPHLNDQDPERRLRIGYVSPDFREHSVAYFIEPTLQHHDYNRFEIFCYYNYTQVDETTERLRRYADHWTDCVGMTDDVLADRVRKDQIDILVDLAGHTAKNRLLVFARKPAPVQVTWMGYPNTTGLAAMDYRLTDAYLDPIGKTEQLSTEELVRLPVSACFRPPLESPDIGDLPALEAGYVTFASFNNFSKVTQNVMATWARILRAVNGSRLVIMNVNDGETERYVRQTFSNNGIANTRLNLMKVMPFFEYLEFHNSVDIGLDTFPYNGGTTTCNGTWMGVPHITLAGTSARSRVGVALLSHIGDSNLIASSPDQYVQFAVELANDIGRLGQLRKGLRDGMVRSPLTDARHLTRALEAAYRKMWESHCNR